MSITEYARHRECDLKAVQFAVARGRISRNEDGTIDSELADREWDENTDHAFARYGPKPARERTSHREAEKAQGRASAAALAEDPRPGLSFHGARAAREVYEAQLKRLTLEQKRGNLLPRAEVEAATQNMFQIFREAMLNVPNRVAGVLAAETDPLKVHETLEQEIRQALQDFAGAEVEGAA